MRIPTVKIRNSKTGKIRKVNQHEWAQDLGRFTDWSLVTERRGDANWKEEELVHNPNAIENNVTHITSGKKEEAPVKEEAETVNDPFIASDEDAIVESLPINEPMSKEESDRIADKLLKDMEEKSPRGRGRPKK